MSTKLKTIARNLAKHGLYADLLSGATLTELVTIQGADRFVVEIRTWGPLEAVRTDYLPGRFDELGWPTETAPP